jgi:hypothetical protein
MAILFDVMGHERRVSGRKGKELPVRAPLRKATNPNGKVYVARYRKEAHRPLHTSTFRLFASLQTQQCSPPTLPTQPSKSSSSVPAPPARPQTSPASPALPTLQTPYVGAVIPSLEKGSTQPLREGRRIGGGILVRLLGRLGMMGGRGEFLCGG